jgi:hypothetical protein
MLRMPAGVRFTGLQSRWQNTGRSRRSPRLEPHRVGLGEVQSGRKHTDDEPKQQPCAPGQPIQAAHTHSVHVTGCTVLQQGRRPPNRIAVSGLAAQVSYSPGESGLVSVVGQNIYKVFKIGDSALRQLPSPFIKRDPNNCPCSAWLPDSQGDRERLLLGTDTGDVVLIEVCRVCITHVVTRAGTLCCCASPTCNQQLGPMGECARLYTCSVLLVHTLAGSRSGTGAAAPLHASLSYVPGAQSRLPGHPPVPRSVH